MNNIDEVLSEALVPRSHADRHVIANIQNTIAQGEKGTTKKAGSNVISMFGRIAAAVAILLAVGGGTVFAAEKLNLFGHFFGNSDEEPIADYVANADVNSKDKVYEGTFDDYKITVEKMLYCNETDYGMVQIRVEDLTGDGRQWCLYAEYAEQLNSWELSETMEMYESHEKGQSPKMCFQMSGAGNLDYNMYGTREDDNITVCQIVFGSFNYADFDADNLTVNVIYNENDSSQTVMQLDVPVGESLPCYVWTAENGESSLKLSSVNYMLFAAAYEDDLPDDMYREIIAEEVSVKMKDGSEYILYSDKNKVMHELHGFAFDHNSESGIWYPFDSVLDLDQVQSFMFDGMEFDVSDAEIKFE